MTTAFITHKDCQLHEMGLLNPESPLRIDWIIQALKQSGLYEKLKHFEAQSASKQQLERIHDPRHLKALYDILPETGHVSLDLETKVNKHTMTAAIKAAGANIQAVQLVMQQQVNNAFCCVRPPGHHAESDRAVGFCFLNNIGAAVAEALSYENINKVLIIDFDVHHGNGTEEIFLNDERVMICSIFQSLLMPRKLFEEDENRIVNVPLDSGSGSQQFRSAVKDKWLPAIEKFKPDFIFIAAGFDAHWMDTVSGLNFTESDYEWITQEILKIADKHCCGRIVSSLEGGYNFRSLSSSVLAHVNTLMNFK